MSTVVVDRTLGEKLRAATGVIEIRDEAGELIGIFDKVSKGSDPSSRQSRTDSGDPTDDQNY